MNPETGKKMSISELIASFNDRITKAESFLLLSRSSRLQYEQALELNTLVHDIARTKQIAIANQHEDLANLFLGFECAVGAIRSELMMYVLLKRDDANAAWDRLVAAQMGCLDAMRAHEGFADCAKRLAHLHELEKQLFPPQTFMSAGFLSTQLDCSICGQPTAKCDHLRGRPYMGQLCEFIHREPRGDHVALVEVPADKRCRVVSIKTKDGHKDRITLEVTPYKEGESYSENGTLEVSTIFLALQRFPYMEPVESVGRSGSI
ncbi:hypothetical protein [Herbaspirillum rubrisubalbicans]|uniref:hypothetical protein n=1 Tax=Herbaspirillum rubrisubalbicans TaxID=80842 RepID=UPI0015C54648|nr:hypothetical protein [Herbaspirillum rubrisubalbicans]